MRKALALILLLTSPAFAEVEMETSIVTTPSKVEENKAETGRSIELIKDLEFNNIDRTFNFYEGLRVKRVQDYGGLTTVRIRGMRSFDTKFLFNGLPFYDPSDPQGSANPFIGDILSTGMSMEVLKGSAGSTYGTNAVGGIVNLIPDSGLIDKWLEVGIEFGANSTLVETVKLNVRDLTLSVSRLDSDGIDAHDRYENTSLNAAYRWEVSDRLIVTPSIYFHDVESMLNGSPFINVNSVNSDHDDENDRREGRVLQLGLRTVAMLTDKLLLFDDITLIDSKRRFTFLPDEDGSGFFSDNTFTGRAIVNDARLAYYPTGDVKLSTTLGYEFTRDFYELETLDQIDEADRYKNDLYARQMVPIGNATLTLLGRLNNHELVKGHNTYDVSLAVPFDAFSIHSHYGTAFRSPSLYELHGAFVSEFGRFEIGNLELGPEKSRGGDVGIESRVFGSTVGVTYFDNLVTNPINFVGFGYKNEGDDYRANGVEGFVKVPVLNLGNLRMSATQTNTADYIDVPERQYSSIFNWKHGKLHGFIGWHYLGKHSISVFNINEFTVDRIGKSSRNIFDIGVSMDVTPDFEVFIRGENATDNNYKESGFRTPGGKYYGGVKLRF